MKADRAPSRADRAHALTEWRELRRLCLEEGTGIDGLTKEQAIAHMRRVRERLWKAKHPSLPRRALASSERGPSGEAPVCKTTTRPDHRSAAQLFEELFRISEEEGTAVDGMTKEEVIAHMRRVRERLWKAKHAPRPRQQ